MGTLIVIGLIWLFIWVINQNADSESPTMGDFEVRLFDEKTGELGLDAKRVQIRGLVPLVRATNLGFVVVLFMCFMCCMFCVLCLLLLFVFSLC